MLSKQAHFDKTMQMQFSFCRIGTDSLFLFSSFLFGQHFLLPDLPYLSLPRMWCFWFRGGPGRQRSLWFFHPRWPSSWDQESPPRPGCRSGLVFRWRGRGSRKDIHNTSLVKGNRKHVPQTCGHCDPLSGSPCGHSDPLRPLQLIHYLTGTGPRTCFWMFLIDAVFDQFGKASEGDWVRLGSFSRSMCPNIFFSVHIILKLMCTGSHKALFSFPEKLLFVCSIHLRKLYANWLNQWVQNRPDGCSSLCSEASQSVYDAHLDMLGCSVSRWLMRLLERRGRTAGFKSLKWPQRRVWEAILLC